MLVKDHFHDVTEMLDEQDLVLVGDSEAKDEEDSD